METIDLKDIDPSLLEAIRRIRLVAFDFDGVFTDNMVYVMQDGSEAVRCNRSDGLGLQKLKKMGIETVIISTEANPVVSARAQKLKIRCFQNCENKVQTLQNLTREFGISLDQVAFVGNDINDQTCLNHVGLPIVVKDAHPDVVSMALYQTNHPGGRGAVREVCDLFDQVLAK
ncbi:MAG: HAD hydrolase family protein [Deltaproteobacteria bacterium]|jgi:YrbI family 3-deoxy-D-manno-octulosonate 8-phosphate phosphatase|nr:HAD hydrolase family protein [Deltaproteobacteria bacterium]